MDRLILHDWGLKIFKVTSENVIPAKAGINKLLTLLDSHRSLPHTGYGAGVTNWELLEVLLFVEVLFPLTDNVGCMGVSKDAERFGH